MRLTKENYEDDSLHLKNKTQSQYNNELWQYVKEREDIEKNLDIGLKIIGMLLLQGDVYVDGVGYVKFNLNKYGISFIPKAGEWCSLPFEGYGKTWALTKEELEHAK